MVLLVGPKEGAGGRRGGAPGVRVLTATNLCECVCVSVGDWGAHSRPRQACDLCQPLVSGLGRDVNYRARSAQPRGCKFTASSRINHVT